MKTILGFIIVLLILSLYIETNEVREPIRFRGTWACDGSGYRLLYFDGKQAIQLGDEDTAGKIPPPELKPEVWCERVRPVLLVWLSPDGKALKPVRNNRK